MALDNQGEAPYDEAAALRAWRGIGEVIPPTVKRALAKRPKRS